MDTSLNEVVNYNLNFDNKKILMNDLINSIINISWKGKVICQCGREMKKFYRSGFLLYMLLGITSSFSKYF